MFESYLLKGLLVGFIFGVPVGAIGALTLQRTLTHGFWAGLLTGLGCSVADLLYACVGVLGLTMISDFLLLQQNKISLIGGGLILLLGILICCKKSKRTECVHAGKSLPAFFASSFAIALANPATILSFLIAFASFGIGDHITPVQSAQLLGGILLGTSLWWGLLSGVTALLRHRVTDKLFHRLHFLLGSLMSLFGFAMILRGLYPSF